MADIEKKVPDEIKDEELDFVAGGAYTEEQWLAMSKEERAAEVIKSAKAQKKGEYCAMV